MSKNLHYPVLLSWSDTDEAFIAVAPQLEGCVAHGDSREEALANLEEVISEWMKSAEKLNWVIPVPQSAQMLEQKRRDMALHEKEKVDEQVKAAVTGALERLVPQLLEQVLAIQDVGWSSSYFYQGAELQPVEPRRKGDLVPA